MIANLTSNTKRNPLINELFVGGSKLNISLGLVTQSYFKVPKEVRLNSTHFFIIQLPNKGELQQNAINHSSDIEFKYFMKIYKKYTAEKYSFLANETNFHLILFV